MHDNETIDTHEGDSNLNESVEALIDPVKNSIDLNDNEERDQASNNTEPLDNLLKATHNMVPAVNGNEEVANVVKILTTIPTSLDPLFPEGSSIVSTAILAGDSSVEQTPLRCGHGCCPQGPQNCAHRG